MSKLILFLIFFLPQIARAELLVIDIQGLSFECDSCKKLDSNQCELKLEGKVVSGACDSFLEVLLKQANVDGLIKYPTDNQLLSFLAREDIDSKLVALSFELLTKRSLDQITLASAINLLIAKHLNILQAGIENKSFKDEVYSALWNKRSELPLRERFILTKYLYGIEAFFLDLDAADYKQDLIKLTTLIESDIISDLEKGIFNELSQYIHSCAEQLQCEKLPEDFGPEAIKYSNRLQNLTISRAIIEHRLNGIDALKQLALVKYRDHRTPDTYEALLSALGVVLKLKPFSEDWKRLPTPVVDFVTFMSEDDPRVAELIYGNSGDENSMRDWILVASLFSMIVIASAYTYVVVNKKNKKRITKRDDIQQKNELAELMTIWTFFGLPSDSTLSDLKRRYRELARELHPDSGRESSEEFMQLNSYYKRAMELLKS